MAPRLVAILIAEMHFDAADMFRQMAERVFHRRFDLFGQFFMTCDVVVCVYLVHDFCFFLSLVSKLRVATNDHLFPVEAHDFAAIET